MSDSPDHHHHHHHHREGQGGYPGGHTPQGGYPAQGGNPPQGGYPGQYPGYQPPQPVYTQSIREFQVISDLNHKVLDIKEAKVAEGTEVIMYDSSHGVHARNQLWYLDPQGFIRSALNDMVFFNSEKGHDLKMTVYNGQPAQQWRFDHNKIVNGLGLCLDIRGNSHANGANLCEYDYKGSTNQHWTLRYVN